MHQKTRIAIATAIAMAAPCAAQAEDILPSWLSLSGFGTLGAVQTNTDLARYATNALQPNGARKDPDFGIDSLLAGQADVRAGDRLGFTVQVVANRTADDDYKPHVEWAFGRFAVTNEVSVRAGILATPVFMQSDSRLVGFANPWVRPPTAVYAQLPLTDFRGVDLVWRHGFGDVTMALQPYLGNARPKVPYGNGSVTADVDQLRGAALSGESGRGPFARATCSRSSRIACPRSTA